MLLYPLLALVTSFPDIVFIIKGNANNGRNLPYCPFRVLMTHLRVISFINEEASGCITEESIGAINESAIGAIIAPRKVLLVLLFHVLLFQLCHQLIFLVFLVTLHFYQCHLYIHLK